MDKSLEELKRIRLDKLHKLEQNNVAGFSAWSQLRTPITNIRDNKNNPVSTSGRLTALRGHGGLMFADLVDETGKIQLAFKKNTLLEQFNILNFLDIGDFIFVSGELFTTQAGELTIEVKTLKLLTKSLRPLPSNWYGFSDIEERYRQRYVDLLVNPEVKNVFEIRSKVTKLLRQKLDEAGFLEVETPVLQPLYGGATAKPFVTHHNTLDMDLYLRVSDELYLKKLIVGGFEKVYEIGKDFRNEGIDRQHNPEFTMCEFYWAYANIEDLMKFTEKILSEIIHEIVGSYRIAYQDTEYDFSPPWTRITYRDLLLKDCGVDIDVYDTETKLLLEIKNKNIKLDMDGVVGYGALLDTLYKTVSRPKIVGPLFITDYPMEILPLAKKKATNPKMVGSFQLLVGSFEWIKAYDELNDPIDQRKRWEEEMVLAGKGLEEYQMVDEDYLRALEYGMPPTAGWGLGIDRFVAFLTNQHGLKDTILFPTMRSQ